MKLGIVIVNYNSKDYLAGCLQSIHRETRETPFEVAVVDNASLERDFRALRDAYPDVAFILNSENRGFSTACNQGLRALNADFYLLLNPDSVVVDGALDRSVRFLLDHPRAGIVGCRVTNPDGSLQLACRRRIPRPSTAFYRLSGLGFLFPRRFGVYNLADVDDGEPHEVEAVSGSFLLFRREVLETSGYLDESFFLYGEDLDFCYRALRRGWEVHYFPGARVTHFKRASSSTNIDAGNYHFYNAMRIFYRKHFAPQANPVERGLVLTGIQLLYWATSLRRLFPGKRGVGSAR
jgi:O-antigen biosynthesis protein